MMSTRRLATVFVAATIGAAGAGILSWGPLSDAAWAGSRYASAEGAFSVAFPADPVVEGRPAASDDDSSFWTYVATDQGGAFAVRVDQFPQSIRPPTPDRRTYELLLRNHAVESAGRLVTTTPARVGGLAGMQGVFSSQSGGEEQVRVLMVGRRVYQVSYKADHASASTGAAFLDSFRPTGR